MDGTLPQLRIARMPKDLVDASSQHYIASEEEPDHSGAGTRRTSTGTLFVFVILRHEFDDGENDPMRLVTFRQCLSLSSHM